MEPVPDTGGVHQTVQVRVKPLTGRRDLPFAVSYDAGAWCTPTVQTANVPAGMLRVAVMMFAGLVALFAPTDVIGAMQSAPASSPVAIHTFVQQLETTTKARVRGRHTFAQPYSWWSWPGGGFYDDTSENITIESTTTPGQPYFWSYQFHSQYGDGGYVGLQDASVPSGKKIALFSVWQAERARGTKCNVFSGEGSGESCRIDPYNWTTDRTYTLALRIASSGSTGAWYEATVTDTVTQVTSTRSDRYTFPPVGVDSTASFLGPNTSAAQPTRAPTFPKHVRVSTFRLSLGAVQITKDTHVIGTGNCPSQITGYAGGDRQVAPK